MNLASKAFFVFLPTVLLLYHSLGRRSHKYSVLLIASWVFYAWAAPGYLAVLLGLTVIDYCAGRKIEATTDDRTRRMWLTLSIVSNLGLLAAFKYTPFVYDSAVSLAQMTGVPVAGRAWEILLPLGISFHTFQGISYTVDVYRRQVKAVHSFLDYALFVAFFPQLAAGPIVRAVEFLPQMVTPPRVTAGQVTDGLNLLVLGLFKKMFVADQLDQLFVSPVFARPEAFDPVTHRWAVAAWAVQIYCDFSGYTDIAVGTAKLFGFELPANFRLPYLATSIADFWRRWHLTLSMWLRDYLYFPLGGSKGTAARTYFNLTVIFVLCGLWHGAEWRWFVYGLYNGVLMSLHRVYDRAATGVPWADALRASPGWKLFAWAATTAQLLAGLVLIRMESWAGGWVMLESLAGVGREAVAGTAATAAWVGGVPVAVPGLMLLGLAGHFATLGKDALSCGTGLWPVRIHRPEAGATRVFAEPVRAFASAALVVVLVTLSPGVGKTFIYIQF